MLSAERTAKDGLCILETYSILKLLLLTSLLMLFNITICQDDCVGIIALCSFVDGGTGWPLAVRVVNLNLICRLKEGRQEQSASKIKLLDLFLQPGLLGLLNL